MTSPPPHAHGPLVPAAAPRPPFDAELQVVLDGIGPFPAVTPATISAARRGLPGMSQLTDEQLSCGGQVAITDRTITLDGGSRQVRLTVCRPSSAGSSCAAVYFIHGGGMISGDSRSGLDEAIRWALDLDLTVFSVDYRIAPEVRHPGPVDDCFDGLAWIVEHAGELQIDPDRVVVAGVSAGGGLAAAVALMARDRGHPSLRGQMLIYPMLDDRNSSASTLQMGDSGTWGRTANDTGWTALLGEDVDQVPRLDHAAPARASSLADLPPTFVDVGSAEIFRDEDTDYVQRIWREGGQAELHVWPGAYHGFDSIAPRAQISQDARRARLNWLRRLLREAPDQ